MVATIYKIVPLGLWQLAVDAGHFAGAGVDLRDGYLHLSTAQQVRETALRHFAGVSDLLLVAVSTDALGSAVRWEPSRGGDLFPHLYGRLPLTAVRWAKPLALDALGRHMFPDLD